MTEENTNPATDTMDTAKESAPTDVQDSSVNEVPTSIGSFAMVFIIIDLVFVAITLFGVVSTLVIPSEILEAAGTTQVGTLFTVISGLGIFLLGGVGNIAMLMKKEWGAKLCYSALLFVLISIVGGFTQLEQAQAMTEGVPGADTIVLVSVIVSALVRVGYSIAYVFAIKSGVKNIRLMEQG